MSALSNRGATRERGRSAMTAVAERYGLLIALLVVIVGFSVILPSTYPTTVNLKIVLSGQATFLMLALAVTLPLRAGEFDLSIGAVAVAAATVVGSLTALHGVSLGVAIVIALAAGVLVGAVNAAVVVGIGVNAFIATLGTMTVVSGLALAISHGGQVIVGLPTSLENISNKTVLTLPLRVWYGWLLALALWYVYQFTPFGRRLLFTGGNPAAARLTGIQVRRVKTTAFILSGLISAAAGIFLAGSLSAVDPTTSGDYLLQPYAAAFLGTTVLQVGRFNALGTVIGLYLLAAGVSGLELLGVQTWVNDVFNGGTLILAVVGATLMRRGIRQLAASRGIESTDRNGGAPDRDATTPQVATDA
jgi:ribose transport system permease protein